MHRSIGIQVYHAVKLTHSYPFVIRGNSFCFFLLLLVSFGGGGVIEQLVLVGGVSFSDQGEENESFPLL